MAAAFAVQNDTGTTPDANAYIDEAFFRQYHLDRGRDTTALTADKVTAGIVRATDYIDTRWRARFAGQPLEDEQTTEWPRQNAYYRGKALEGVVTQLKKATAEYALRAASAELLVDGPSPIGDDGQPQATGQVLSASVTVGPVSTSNTYAERSGVGSGTATTSQDLLPRIPAADLLIEPLLSGTGQRRAIRS